MKTLTLAAVVREHAVDRADHRYLYFDGQWTSFAQLDERTNRIAQALLAAGVRKGDRVALLDKNRPECFDVMFASAKCGAVYVPLNWRLAPREIAELLADASPVVLFVGREFLPKIANIAESVSSIKAVIAFDESADASALFFDAWRAPQGAKDPGVESGPEDVALLMYTSGTTGRPKAAMLTNRSLLGHMHAAAAVWDYDEQSVQLVAMPLFHIGGTSIALESIVLGATTVLMAEVDPARMLELISELGVTNMLLVPAIIQYLVDSPRCRDTDWSTVRSLIYGAAPISDSLLRRAMASMQCNFIQIYGMTEHCGCAASLPPEDHDPDGRPELLASCGKPLPWVEVNIVDPGSGVALSGQQVGEIRIRSTQLMSGYWKQPEATAAALTPDGWLRTGDAGYFDDDGYLYICDRIKDMIISGGENIYPAEIENVLTRHPLVADAAVIGVPHEKWGETPKALVIVVPGSELRPQELIDFCREQLATFKCPTSVEFVSELPRNPSGKLLKRELREPYWKNHSRRVS